MPQVLFQPSEQSVEVPAGTELLEAARLAGVEIDAPCGGKGTCGKCMVRVLSGEVDSDSLGVLPGEAVADGYVLACKTVLLDQDVVIETPEKTGWEGGKFAESLDEECLIRRELLPSKWDLDPLTVRWVIQVPAPEADDGLSDFERFQRALQQQWGKNEVICSLRILQKLSGVLREVNGEVTVTMIREPGKLHVLSLESGVSEIRSYGLAVDIGTTTVAVQLVHLNMGEIVATRSDYNAQISCGLDVISRINYAARPERLAELRERVLTTINGLIDKVAESHQVPRDRICDVVMSGNTTMIHLLLGLPPEHIRLDPYTPTVMNALYLRAEEIGIQINPDSWVRLSPAVGSYVGGDITAGLLCTDLVSDTDEVNLFIDIGTNGELVLGNSDFLLTCACSAGPAFEGGGIDCGMRAALGAIERVEMNPDGTCRSQTVGDVKPLGICGSGMIGLLADLFLAGWIDPSGKLTRDRQSPAIEVDGRHARYCLASAEQSGTGKPLFINETDIENIIRAKAAIYSACALMLEQVEMTFDDLAHVYIAGGFGRFLDLEKATILGLIPDLPRERFHYIGNASLMGSYMTLVSQDYTERQIETANRMTYIDLGADPAYMDQYTAALFLPHTDPSLFPSVKPQVN